MKLLGVGLSPYYRKVRVVLEEKGIAYETEPLIALPKTPELMAMNPLGKIPILKDGDRIIPDSSVICAYLEKLHPSPALYPSDAGTYAEALFLEEYADTKMVEVMGGLAFEKVVKPQYMNGEPDAEKVAQLEGEELPTVLDYLESRLGDGATTLLDGFSIADAAVGAAFGSWAFAGGAPDAASHPRLAAYLSALDARASFQAAARD